MTFFSLSFHFFYNFNVALLNLTLHVICHMHKHIIIVDDHSYWLQSWPQWTDVIAVKIVLLCLCRLLEEMHRACYIKPNSATVICWFFLISLGKRYWITIADCCLFQTCPSYWPTDPDTPLQFGPLKITLLEEKTDDTTTSILIRTFNVENDNSPAGMVRTLN